MAQDLFEVQTADYEVVQGDTLNIARRFWDKYRNPINDIVDQSWDSIFSLEDPISHDIITALQKTHNDTPPVGDGIYYNGDVNVVPGLNITLNNEVVMVLTALETQTLLPGVYPLYLKFLISQAYDADYTALRGNLTILKRNT